MHISLVEKKVFYKIKKENLRMKSHYKMYNYLNPIIRTMNGF